MSTKVVYESEACECCLQWVANNDDSSCLASVPGAHNV